MGWTLNRTDILGVEADSLCASFSSSTSLLFGLGELFWGTYVGGFLTQPVGMPGQRRPIWGHVESHIGGSTGTISGSMATELAKYPRQVTKWIIQLGINDVGNLVGATDTVVGIQTKANTILSAIIAAGYAPQTILWIGPWAHDSGDWATQIAQVDAGLQSTVTGLKCNYVSVAGVSNGGGNAIGDGVHPTYQGARFALAPQIQTAITYQLN